MIANTDLFNLPMAQTMIIAILPARQFVERLYKTNLLSIYLIGLESERNELFLLKAL